MLHHTVGYVTSMREQGGDDNGGCVVQWGMLCYVYESYRGGEMRAYVGRLLEEAVGQPLHQLARRHHGERRRQADPTLEQEDVGDGEQRTRTVVVLRHHGDRLAPERDALHVVEGVGRGGGGRPGAGGRGERGGYPRRLGRHPCSPLSIHICKRSTTHRP